MVRLKIILPTDGLKSVILPFKKPTKVTKPNLFCCRPYYQPLEKPKVLKPRCCFECNYLKIS